MSLANPDATWRTRWQWWCWDYPDSWAQVYSRLGMAKLIADGKIQTWRQKQVEWHGESQGILMDNALRGAAAGANASAQALSSENVPSGTSITPVDTSKSSDGANQQMS